MTYECHHIRHGDASVPAWQKSIIADVDDQEHTESNKEQGGDRVVLEGHDGLQTFTFNDSSPSFRLAPARVRTRAATVGNKCVHLSNLLDYVIQTVSSV